MFKKLRDYVKDPTHKDHVMLSLFITIILLCSSLAFILGYGVRSVDLRYALEVERVKFNTLAVIALKQQEELNDRALIPDSVTTIDKLEDHVEEACK